MGIYFISEDIYTTASYYTFDRIKNWNPLPQGWEILPDDEFDIPMGSREEKALFLEKKETAEAAEFTGSDRDADGNTDRFLSDKGKADELKDNSKGDS